MILFPGQNKSRNLLKTIKIKSAFLLLFAMVVLFLFLCSVSTNGQGVYDNFDFYLSSKYSPNLYNSMFLKNPNYHGTVIAQLDKKKLFVLKITDNDTTGQKNALSIRESSDGDRILICLNLDNYDVDIDIFVYNLLGKKVMDVWSGKAINETCPKEYEILKAKLTNGLYICVAQGANFRLVGKFIISR